MTSSTLTVATLSWASPITAARSFDSWIPLLESRFVVQRLAYFQELRDVDVQLARRYGFEVLGDGRNIGIGPAYRALLDRAAGSHFLFLECDWRLLERPWSLEHVQSAMGLVDEGVASVVRLRSRSRPGWPINPAQLQNRELTYPYWLLDSALWEPAPERIFPQFIERIDFDGEDWLLANTPYAGWSNNPHVAHVEWLRANVRPFTTQPGKAFEGVIDDHWRLLPDRVAQGRGVFTHDRIDGPGHRSRALHRRLGYPLRLRVRRRLRPFYRRRNRMPDGSVSAKAGAEG